MREEGLAALCTRPGRRFAGPSGAAYRSYDDYVSGWQASILELRASSGNKTLLQESTGIIVYGYTGISKLCR